MGDTPESPDAVPPLPRTSSREHFEIGQIPEGRYPAATLAIVVLAMMASGWEYIDPRSAFGWLGASAQQVWGNKQWTGLITTSLLHGDFLHLLFNCYWIWIFGRLLENRLGPIRLLGFFLFTAWVSSVAELALTGNAGIGLSGVGYALFGFIWVNRSRDTGFSALLPDRLVVMFLIWLFICIGLTAGGVMRVANASHIGGLLTGAILGWAWPGTARAFPARAGIVLLLGLSIWPVYSAPWLEQWLEVQALNAVNAKQDEKALQLFAKLQAKYPSNDWAVFGQVQIEQRRGRHGEARRLLEGAVALRPNADNLNSLAWILCTAPDEKVRDGKAAVGFAERACEQAKWLVPAYTDTLAAAHAEAGNFPDAVKFAKQALLGLGESSDAPTPDDVPILSPESSASITAELQRHLAAFKAGRPWREP